MKYAVLGILLVGSLALGTSADADADADVPSDAPVVKLVTAGKAPKQTLRLIAKPGFHQTAVMTMAMGMRMQSGGKDLVPMTRMPEIRMTLDLAVASVAPSGDMRCTFKITRPELAPDPNAAPAIVAAMTKSIAGLDGMSGYAVITNRGFTRDADFEVGPNIEPELKQLLDGMRQSLHQLAAPLPAEPVGKGARWETTMHLAMNGMSLTQVASYQLVELAGHAAKLNVTMKQDAGRQKIQRNGMTFDLISLTSSGTGSMVLDLAQLIATPATIALQSAMDMEAMGQKMSMNIDMTMGIARK